MNIPNSYASAVVADIKAKIKNHKKVCYYDDNLCDGKVSTVNSHHGFLCEKCLKEYNNIKD